MARQKNAKKQEKREYTVRRNSTMRDGEDTVYGPDTVTLSLDRAYAFKHCLVEREAIVKEWKARDLARREARVKADQEFVESRRAKQHA